MNGFRWFCIVVFFWFLPLSAMGADFINNGDGTVTDRETGLIWQQTESCCQSQRLARRYCEEMIFAGHADWRLPNVKELESIVDDDTNHPAINTEFFPMTVSTQYNFFDFWSSTAYAGDTHYFWRVLFQTGDLDHYAAEEHESAVRCVCGGE